MPRPAFVSGMFEVDGQAVALLDLDALLALQTAEVRADVEIASACSLLTKLLPTARYPEAPEPSPDEARRAIAAAREVRQRLAKRLGR